MDEPEHPDEAPIFVAPGGEPGGAGVAFVVPAPMLAAIATDDPAVAVDAPTVPPPAFDAAPVLDALGALGGAILGRLDGLQARFDREVRAEGTREKVVDRLHAELQEHKQGLLLGLLRPIFADLIQLHDDVGRLVGGLDESDAGSARAVELGGAVRQEVEDILYRQGVEPFSVEGDAFDPRRQRAASTVPNDDPARARTVAARLRPGFRAGDKVIRPEVVAVHAAPAPAPSPAACEA